MKKTVIIAAAGMGNRLGMELPKCLVKLNGYSIFEYQLKAFKDFDEIRMVVGYKAENVISAVSAINHNVVFVRNDDFLHTTTLQSMYMGSQGVDGKALFVDGDMILSRKTSREVATEIEGDGELIGVASDISEEPVYVGIENGNVTWFYYDRTSKYEWANLAYIDCAKLEYNKTHFFTQLEKFLPVKAHTIERLEIDTLGDYEFAEKIIRDNPEKFNFWE